MDSYFNLAGAVFDLLVVVALVWQLISVSRRSLRIMDVAAGAWRYMRPEDANAYMERLGAAAGVSRPRRHSEVNVSAEDQRK